MEFKPKTEEEVQKNKLAPKGEYDFEVLKAEDRPSKKGNAMIEVKLGIYDCGKIRWYVKDYLLPSMEAKLRHFCDTTGLLSKYEEGTLCAKDCRGRSGRVRLRIREDREGQYPPKNEVADYAIRPAKPLGSTAANQQQPEANDDLPF